MVFKLNIKNHLHISKKSSTFTPEKEDKITPKIQEKEDNTIHKPRIKEDKQAFNRMIIRELDSQIKEHYKQSNNALLLMAFE